MLEQISAIARKTPGVEHAITIGGVRVDCNASLANAGVIISRSTTGTRHKGQDLKSLTRKLVRELSHVEVHACRSRRRRPSRASACRGGFQMQVELTDGTIDYRKLQTITDLLVSEGNTNSSA